MPDLSGFVNDIVDFGEEAKLAITNVAKRQWRLRFTNACRVCNNLNLNGHEATQVIGRLYLRLLIVRESACKGCYFCVLLVNIVDHYVPGTHTWAALEPPVEIELTLEYGEGGMMEVEINDRVGFTFGKKSLQRLEIHAPDGAALQFWPQLPNCQDLSDHSGSDQCFSFIKQRLSLCDGDHMHSKCREKTHPVLPKRLIEIGLQDHTSLKLCETIQGQTGRYIALSHCWGGHEVLKLVSGNLNLMKEQIKWDALPQTFQNAVTVARELKVRWIWIDSLCIIQDDRSDWEIEAFKMGHYYHNAYLTVSATSSPNPATPFLCARDLSALSSTFKFGPQQGTDIVKVRPLVRERYVAYYHVIRNNKDSAYEHKFGPLSTRAWTWQENALSGRVIHYTSTGLVYECRTDKAVHVEDRTHLPTDWVSSLPYVFSISRECSPGAPQDRAWHDLVKTYSDRELTYTSDKLPAISSAAAELLQEPGATYLAGLRKESLAKDLLWQSDDWRLYGLETKETSTKRAPIMTNNGSPSWSWASLTGRLLYRPDIEGSSKSNGHSLIDIHDSNTTLCGPNMFGQVSGGHITLTGEVVEARIQGACPTHHEHVMYPVSSYSRVWVKMMRDTVLESCIVDTQDGKKEQTFRRSPLGQEAKVSVPGIVHCLMVYEGVEWVHCLILVRSDIVPGAYSRIGYTHGGARWKDCKKEMRRITIV